MSPARSASTQSRAPFLQIRFILQFVHARSRQPSQLQMNCLNISPHISQLFSPFNFAQLSWCSHSWRFCSCPRIVLMSAATRTGVVAPLSRTASCSARRSSAVSSQSPHLQVFHFRPQR